MSIYIVLVLLFVLVLVIVTNISLSIAILFYALVYGDDDEDDADLSSGAGTNLKVRMSGAKRRKKCCRSLHFFGFTSTISRFGKCFRVASTVRSLSCFLFFLLSVSPCPVICKSGGTWPRVLGRVSVTFVLQFHTRKHYKTAIQSECITSQGLFPFFAFKITHRVIL